MKDVFVRIFFRSLFLLGALFAIVACNNGVSGFPQVASPPEFDFVDGDELRSGMHQLAFELQLLDLALISDDDRRSDIGPGIVESLNRIERIGNSLQSGDVNSKHPFLREGMERFLADVDKARADASRGSPNFYMAGRVSGACVSCHRANE